MRRSEVGGLQSESAAHIEQRHARPPQRVLHVHRSLKSVQYRRFEIENIPQCTSVSRTVVHPICWSLLVSSCPSSLYFQTSHEAIGAKVLEIWARRAVLATSCPTSCPRTRAPPAGCHIVCAQRSRVHFEHESGYPEAPRAAAAYSAARHNYLGCLQRG